MPRGMQKIAEDPNKTVEDLIQEYLKYNPETGDFIWLHSPHPKQKIGTKAGSLSGLGYWVIGFKRKLYQAHRLAWLLHYGSWPTTELDHINHNRADNFILNLREVTRTGNQNNRSKNLNNNSGHTGVYYSASAKKWHACIGHLGKKKHLGSFETKQEAVSARISAEKHHNYHPNHGN